MLLFMRSGQILTRTDLLFGITVNLFCYAVHIIQVTSATSVFPHDDGSIRSACIECSCLYFAPAEAVTWSKRVNECVCICVCVCVSLCLNLRMYVVCFGVCVYVCVWSVFCTLLIPAPLHSYHNEPQAEYCICSATGSGCHGNACWDGCCDWNHAQCPEPHDGHDMWVGLVLYTHTHTRM